jgi:Holliday junction resolvase YEN1
VYLQAPGEAEAELAQLSATGAIDAIITDDSDAFVFGATQVICTR